MFNFETVGYVDFAQIDAGVTQHLLYNCRNKCENIGLF